MMAQKRGRKAKEWETNASDGSWCGQNSTHISDSTNNSLLHSVRANYCRPVVSSNVGPGILLLFQPELRAASAADVGRSGAVPYGPDWPTGRVIKRAKTTTKQEAELNPARIDRLEQTNVQRLVQARFRFHILAVRLLVYLAAISLSLLADT